jgi:hypothetical protein
MSLVSRYTRFDQTLLAHREMKLQFFIGSRIKTAPGESSSKPSPH